MARNRLTQLLPVTLLAAVFFGGASTASAQEETSTLVLTHANLIDGVSPEARRDVSIVVRGTRIESITSGSPPPSAGAQVVDLKGHWLLPGFVDAHTHVADLASARRALRLGATTVRVLGVSHFADVGLRELNRGGMSDIPAVVASGYQIRPDLAEGFFLDFPELSAWMKGLHGSDNLRRMVRIQAEHHVDVIKVLATERAGTADTDPRKRTFTDEELVAIVDEAHKAGLAVTAHAHSDEGIRAAVLAGVRSIEHGTLASDETLALMKARGTWLVSTITALNDPGSSPDPTLQKRARAMQPWAGETAGRAWKMGVRIVAATDSTYDALRSRSVADEVAELVRNGIPPMDSIKAATSGAAECIGVEKRVGTVKPGMNADFIVVDRDPLTNIGSLQDLLVVIHDGKVIVNRLNP